MKTGTFMDIVSVHYNKIKSLFKSRSHGSIDEDSFNDAFIKCAQKFGNEQITYDGVIKYFWVVYSNMVKANIANEHRLELVSIDNEIHDCIDESDNDYTINIYNTITNAITAEYSEEDMMMYTLYKFHDWTIQDLIDSGYDCSDFDNHIKEIHRFVKTYCKKHIKH